MLFSHGVRSLPGLGSRDGADIVRAPALSASVHTPSGSVSVLVADNPNVALFGTQAQQEEEGSQGPAHSCHPD